MDSISEQRLKEVHPKLAAAVRALAAAHHAEFPDTALRVTQGLRTWEEQEELYDQGRTAPGSIVTNAPPGHSWHCFGLAVDIVPLVNGLPDWDHTHSNWIRMIELGQNLGLVSGSCWHSIKDFPHFQLQGTLPVSPDDATRAAYASGGVRAVWTLGGLLDTAQSPGEATVAV